MSSTNKVVLTCAIPPSLVWHSLVRRSTEAWETLIQFDSDALTTRRRLPAEILQRCNSLDDFLHKAPDLLMFWFFQRREAFLSQATMPKWSAQNLDDYILIPTCPGFVSRAECFFVSHYWRTPDNPDPDGKYLRLLQHDLKKQRWSYVWTDWTCAPQHPRSEVEGRYFMCTLDTMSAIIRNCGFAWYYPPFEARLWILYEVAEFILTSSNQLELTEDIVTFADHVNEMSKTSVRTVLDKYGYKCTHARDKSFLTSWLELLVLLRRLKVHIYYVRRLMDHITWNRPGDGIFLRTMDGMMELRRYDGILILGNGEEYKFSKFPSWDKDKYSSRD